jgi:putative peptide zinc metalloprotease protein
VVTSSPVTSGYLAVTLAGLLALVAVPGRVSGAEHGTLSVATYLALLGGLVLSTLVHELAHAAALVARGGRPRRLGVMIFYLSPAFFCDVSDAWALPVDQRAPVAAAGIVAHLTLGGLASLAGLALSGTTARALVVFVCLCYLYGLLNALPFVKLDGYVALATSLDVPFLRDRARGEFHRWIGGWLFGSRLEGGLPGCWWAPLYGAACSLMPVLLVVTGLLALSAVLVPLGPAGAVVVAALGAGAGAAAVVLAVRLGRRLWCERTGLLRFAAGTAAAASLVAALTLVHLPAHVAGGYAVVSGRPVVVAGRPASLAALRPGQRLRIQAPGLVPGATTALAMVDRSGPIPCTVPLAALVAVRDTGHTLRAACRGVAVRPVAGRGAPDVGAFRVATGRWALWDWLWRSLVDPALGGPSA